MLFFLLSKNELKTLVRTLVMFYPCHNFSQHNWPAHFQFLYEIQLSLKSFLVLFFALPLDGHCY